MPLGQALVLFTNHQGQFLKYGQGLYKKYLVYPKKSRGCLWFPLGSPQGSAKFCSYKTLVLTRFNIYI